MEELFWSGVCSFQKAYKSQLVQRLGRFKKETLYTGGKFLILKVCNLSKEAEWRRRNYLLNTMRKQKMIPVYKIKYTSKVQKSKCHFPRIFGFILKEDKVFFGKRVFE